MAGQKEIVNTSCDPAKRRGRTSWLATPGTAEQIHAGLPRTLQVLKLKGICSRIFLVLGKVGKSVDTGRF